MLARVGLVGKCIARGRTDSAVGQRRPARLVRLQGDAGARVRYLNVRPADDQRRLAVCRLMCAEGIGVGISVRVSDRSSMMPRRTK